MVAQDALRTAVQGDRAYETRQLSALSGNPDLGIRAGPVAIGIGATLGVEYIDNVRYSSDNQEEDLIISPGMTLGASWAVTRTARLTAGVGLAYRKYLDNDELDYLQLRPESQVALDVPIGDVVLTVYNQISYLQDVIDVPELAGVARYPRLENTAGLTVSWLPERWILQGGYAFYRFWAFDEDYEYLDRGSHQFFGRIGRFLVVKTRAGLEWSLAFTQFDQAIRNDSQSYSFGPFADWFITDRMRLTARGGYVIYEFDAIEPNPKPDSVDGGYGAVQFTHRPTDNFNYRASATHLLQTGIESAITERTDLRFSARYNFFASTYVSGEFTYSIDERSGTGFSERFTYLGPNVTLGYEFLSRIQTTLSYQFRLRDSNRPGRDYQVNRVALSARYRF